MPQGTEKQRNGVCCSSLLWVVIQYWTFQGGPSGENHSVLPPRIPLELGVDSTRALIWDRSCLTACG